MRSRTGRWPRPPDVIASDHCRPATLPHGPAGSQRLAPGPRLGPLAVKQEAGTPPCWVRVQICGQRWLPAQGPASSTPRDVSTVAGSNKTSLSPVSAGHRPWFASEKGEGLPREARHRWQEAGGLHSRREEDVWTNGLTLGPQHPESLSAPAAPPSPGAVPYVAPVPAHRRARPLHAPGSSGRNRSQVCQSDRL